MGHSAQLVSTALGEEIPDQAYKLLSLFHLGAVTAIRYDLKP